jgi:TonB family protein
MNEQSTSHNSTNVIAALFLVVLATVSCARLKQLVQPNTQSDRLNGFNYSVPFGFDNAVPDDAPQSLQKLTILLSGPTEIYIDNIESQPIPLQELGERIQAYAAGKSEYERAVYIAASSNVNATALNEVLNELRKCEINTVSLLISSADRRKDQHGNEGQYEKSMGDIPAPDRVFQVDIRSESFSETAYDAKPNPFTLRVLLRPDHSLDLNNESYRDIDELISKLDEIFDAREANAVFRDNSNEIEKTVLFRIDDNGTNSMSAHKYGDLIRVIDALKEAGTSPIVLTDSRSYWRGPEVTPPKREVEEPTPTLSTSVPKTVSGGVLNGKATSLPKPPYPPAARAVRVSGAVAVHILIDKSGNVIQAKALSGHPLLRAAAEAAARGAKFAPTLLSGQPVTVSGVLTYNFTYEPQKVVLLNRIGNEKGRPKPSFLL